MKNNLCFLSLVLIYGLNGSGCNSQTNNVNSANQLPVVNVNQAPPNADTVTPAPGSTASVYGAMYDKFTKLEEGMSFRQVVDIFGCGGEMVEDENSGDSTYTYRWKNINYGYFYVTFQNEKLISKRPAISD